MTPKSMYFRLELSSTRCNNKPNHTRLTGRAPFKAPNYKQAMYKNYKCQINFDLPFVSAETIFFLRQIVAKNPTNRLTAERALEHESLLRLEMDEMNSTVNVLSVKMKSAPQMYLPCPLLTLRKPQMKAMTEEKQETQTYSKIDSRFLQSANFRFETSNEAYSISNNNLKFENFRSGNKKKLTSLMSSGKFGGINRIKTSRKSSQSKLNRFGTMTGYKRKVVIEDEDYGSENFELSDTDNPVSKMIRNYR